MMDDRAVAITGMSCLFPGADNLDSFWRNILAAKSAIRPIPENRHIDCVLEDDDEQEAIACTHGGFLEAQIPFAPLEYGVMPAICEMADPEQLLTLQMADRALKDSGIDPQKEHLRDTEIIIGRGGYLGGLLLQGFQKIEVLPQIINVLHQLVPGVSERRLARIKAELNSCFGHLTTERSVLAVPNISSGRIANRYDMMGANYTIDAACASALIAAENAVMSLRLKRCERVITGGVFLANNPTFWWLFSRLEAFSSSAGTWPFSREADGMLAGEGIGILVLERLADAEKAGRRIYAVIKGIGSSSDGKGAGLLAPRKEGQTAALQRAYRDADIDPQTVQLLEGHGTATKLGDRTEIEAINEFFGLSSDGIPTRALGSVKSMIGHTMPASGAASLIKTALALYHKILPPTLCKGGIADGLDHSQFYLNTETLPWVHSTDAKRRAGVNAFGFGGINAHAVLEEHDECGADIDDLVMDWPMELFLLAGGTVDELLEEIRALLDKQNRYQKQGRPFGLLSMDACRQGHRPLEYRMAVMAENFSDLADKLQKAHDQLTVNRGQAPIREGGIYFETEPLNVSGKIVFLFPGNAFPGLGDDYTVRLGQLSLFLPFFRLWFDRLEQKKPLSGKPYGFSTLLFSPAQLDHEKHVRLKKELRILDHSASGVFVANAAGNDLMTRLGIMPDMITGTSLGEWSAAVAAGMIEMDQIAAMSVYAKGQEIDEIKGAIGLTRCSIETLAPYLDEFNREEVTVTCSMDLSPNQVVFAGTRDSVPRFCKHLNQAGIWAECLNLFPIHTPLCRPVADLIYRRLEGLRVSPSSIPTYSAATMEPFPADAEKMRTLLADNAVLPVQMRSLFTKLYDDGARIFLQLGGGGKFATPIHEIFGDKPYAMLPLDVANRHPLHQLQHVLASLYAHHTAIKTDMLFDFRKRYLSRGAGKKSKRSELMVNLSTIAPKIQIKSERLDGIGTANESQTATRPQGDSMCDAPEMQTGAPGREQWEELLSEQMNAMTRMYALQKEEEIAEISHFTNMLQVQAQLLASQSGDTLQSIAAEPDDRSPITASGTAAGSGSHQHNTTPGSSVQKPFAEFRGKHLAKPLPFIGKIESHTLHQAITIRRKLSLQSDLFLKDHAFIPCPNDIKPPEEKLPTLPMAVALEMISEAAQGLFPSKTVCGLKDIRNKRWINLTERVREKELIISGRVRDTGSSEAIEVNCTIAAAPDDGDVCFSGTVLLADGFHSCDPRICIDTEREATRRFDTIDPKSLYRPGGLYHGRCFQGLEKIVDISDTAVEGLLRVPSDVGFFTDHRNGSMILPVQTIDVASQLICCYDLAVGTRNNWVAPISIERVLRCGSSPPPGTPVRSRLMIRSNDSNMVAFDLLLETHGEIFAVIVGWRDWRMKWPERLLASWQNPAVNLLARSKKGPSALSNNGTPVYAVAPEDFSGIDPDWLARLYLSASEYGKWRDYPAQQRLERLTGLIAVKDAARAVLQGDNIFLYPSQVVAEEVSKERFSVRMTGDTANPPMRLFIRTAEQNNETVAMPSPASVDDMRGSSSGKGGLL
jgi:acyl transferase domain-containing protein